MRGTFLPLLSFSPFFFPLSLFCLCLSVFPFPSLTFLHVCACEDVLCFEKANYAIVATPWAHTHRTPRLGLFSRSLEVI